MKTIGVIPALGLYAFSGEGAGIVVRQASGAVGLGSAAAGAPVG